MMKFGYDDVNGFVFGGNSYHGKLFYDNRQQGNDLYADTETELITLAEEKVKQYKTEYAGICYNNGKEWTLRIYN